MFLPMQIRYYGNIDDVCMPSLVSLKHGDVIK